MVALAPAGETVGEMSLIMRSQRTFRPAGGAARHRTAAHQPGRLRSADRAPSARDDESDAADGASGCATPPAAAATAPGPRPSPSCRCRTGLESAPIAHRLASALTEMGSRAAVLDVAAGEQTAEWFNTFEAAHDVVFYRGDAPDSRLDASMPAPGRPHLPSGARRPAFAASARSICPRSRSAPAACRNCCCCIRRAPSAGLPEHFSLRSGLFESHHHIRAGNTDDIRAAGALHRRARRGPGAGGRRRARLRPYRHHQGAEGSGRAVRSSRRHLDGRDHRRGPGAGMGRARN